MWIDWMFALLFVVQGIAAALGWQAPSQLVAVTAFIGASRAFAISAQMQRSARRG